MNTLLKYIKPALVILAIVACVTLPAEAWAQAGTNASELGGAKIGDLEGGASGSGGKVITQVYNIIKFAYVFFYAIAVLLVAQAWLQFKQQKYDVMFASMGAALGLFLTPAIIDFIHGLGAATKT